MNDARPLWRTFLAFLGPLVLTNILQALSATLVGMFVGQMLGTGALAAVAAFYPVLMFFIAFVIGLGAGSSVLAGQAWGARDADKVRAVAGTVLCAGALLGLSVALAGLLFARPMLQLLGTPADVLGPAAGYARVMMLALPVIFVNLLAAAVLRGVSDTVTALRQLVVSTAVVLVATPLLVPHAGVAAGGWATLLANAVSLAWMARHLQRRASPLAPSGLRAHLRIDRQLLAPVVRLGIPTGLFFITGSLADMALVRLVNGYGSQATAAWGAVGQVMGYVMFPAMSIAIAASILAAQAIGAGRAGEVQHVTRVGLGLNLGITGGVALAIAWLAEGVLRIFITDLSVVATAAGLLRIAVWGGVLFGLASVFSGVMRASGTVLAPTVISLGCLVCLLVPLGSLFSARFGLRGIWLSYPVTYGAGLALQAAFFYGVWRRRPQRRLV